VASRSLPGRHRRDQGAHSGALRKYSFNHWASTLARPNVSMFQILRQRCVELPRRVKQASLKLSSQWSVPMLRQAFTDRLKSR